MTPPGRAGPGRAPHEGRYLLGLTSLDRTLSFVGRQTTAAVDREELARRDAVARERRLRRPPADPRPEPLSDRYAAYAERVLGRALYRNLFGAADAALAFVEIASLVTVQPHVDFTFACEAVPEGLDEAQAVELCLPADPRPVEFWGGVTEGRELACTICTRDLNLTVREAKLDLEGGLAARFALGRTAVFCQVVEVGGALYLKDGTHRAVGLAARGFRRLPCVLVRGGRERQIPSQLPGDVLFGPAKPLVTDYLDPDMYLAHPWKTRVKFIRIRVDEFVAPETDE